MKTVHSLTKGIRGYATEEYTAWIAVNKNLDVSSLIPFCLPGLQRALGEESELVEEWEDSEEWKSDVQFLVDAFST